MQHEGHGEATGRKGLGDTPTPPTSKPRAVKLDTARDCRKFLARLVNKAYRDEIPADKAGRLGYLVGIILKSIEVHDLEERVERLEGKR